MANGENSATPGKQFSEDSVQEHMLELEGLTVQEAVGMEIDEPSGSQEVKPNGATSVTLVRPRRKSPQARCHTRWRAQRYPYKWTRMLTNS